MSQFLVPTTAETETVGGPGLSEFLLATSFLLPLFTRAHATKVIGDMFRRAMSPKASRLVVEHFFGVLPRLGRDLIKTADVGIAHSPVFSGVRYEGFLSPLLVDRKGFFKPTTRYPLIGIGSKANPFIVAHELGHLVAAPTRYQPDWARQLTAPVIEDLVRRDVSADLVNRLARERVGLTELERLYYSDPDEVLANAIAIRLLPRYDKSNLKGYYSGLVLPVEHWGVADALAKYLMTGVRP